jgi:photosystem II stability/assembly factor-like uncharacterized protein/PKD repeat protein
MKFKKTIKILIMKKMFEKIYQKQKGFKLLLIASVMLFASFSSKAQNYSVQVLNSGSMDILNSVHFPNADTGYAVGQGGTVLKTTNGGQSWVTKNSLSNVGRSVYFTSTNIGFAAGDDGIYKTTDGFNTWAIVKTGYFRSVYFTDPNTGYAAGNFGNGYGISKTIDGGVTWTNVFNQSAASFLFFQKSNPNIGYASDGQQNLYKTTNAGSTWSTINIPGLTNGASSIFFTDANNGYVGEWGTGIYKTTNGGASWSSLNLGTSFSFTSLYFLNVDTGFAVGVDTLGAKIIYTTNAGTTWATLYSGGNASSVLANINFPNACKGYVSGNLGTLLKITCNTASNPCSINAGYSYRQGLNGNVKYTNTTLGALPTSTSNWYFGDGTSAAGSGTFNTQHTYSANGNYNVVLIVKDSILNCSDTINYSVNVTNANSNPCNTASIITYNYGTNGLVNFTAFSPVMNPLLISYTWNFGDGNFGSGDSISHTYTNNGTYNAFAVAHINGTTCYDTIFQNVVVSSISLCNISPVANISYGPNGFATFQASSNAGAWTSYIWHFGDGGIDSGSIVTHTYAGTGPYNVKLYAYISWFPCSDTLSIIATPGLCNLTANFTSVNATAGSVNFTNTSINTNSNTMFRWDFGNGSIPSNGTNASYTYNLNGQYNVELRAYHYDSIFNVFCLDTTVLNITVTNALNVGCDASFYYGPDSSGVYLFLSTSTGVMPNTTYTWSFGDGSFGIGESTTHTYSIIGVYNVTLVINSFDPLTGNICTDSITIPANITYAGAPCIASVNFTMVPDTSAALTWMAMPVYAPTTVSAIWYWGDGTSTAGFNPSHTYLAPGIYNICVIATDACGAMDTACITSNIMKSSNGSGLIYTVNVISNFTPQGALSIKNAVLDNIKLNVYPNPNSGEFTISAKSETQFSIMNELGQIIKTNATNAANNFSVKVSGLNSGVYFIVANSQNTTYRKKIVVTK